MVPEPLPVIQRLARTFDALGVPYLIGGSIASSLFGISRATQDIDFVADLAEQQVIAFVAALADEFYADADMIREAIVTRASFNVIHLPTMLKVDVFIRSTGAWAEEE